MYVRLCVRARVRVHTIVIIYPITGVASDSGRWYCTLSFRSHIDVDTDYCRGPIR